MEIEQMRNQALNQCIEIANDFTEEEVKKWCPPSVQRAWEIGNTFLTHEVKEAKNRRKGFVL
jgi:hypothetical protein